MASLSLAVGSKRDAIALEREGEAVMLRRTLCSKGVLVLLGVLAAERTGAQAQPADRAAEKAVVDRTFRDYHAAYTEGAPKKVATYFNEPMMFAGVGRVLSTTAEAEEWAAKFIADQRARGIVEIFQDRLEVKLLGQNSAIVSSIVQRRNKEGAVLEVGGGTYLLRKSDKGWKIVAITAYPPADFVKLE